MKLWNRVGTCTQRGPLPKVALALIGLGLAGVVHAQSATVNVTGNITTSCSINTSNVNLVIGTVQASALPAVGSASPYSPSQNLVLSCTVSPASITMRLTGTRDSATVANVFALTPASTARGVGVQIRHSNGGGIFQEGTTYSLPLATTTTIALDARYYRTGVLTAGTANATATFTFAYN